MFIFKNHTSAPEAQEWVESRNRAMKTVIGTVRGKSPHLAIKMTEKNVLHVRKSNVVQNLEIKVKVSIHE